jgi:hypothetical protein
MLGEFHILSTYNKTSMAYTLSNSSPNSWVESWKYNFLVVGDNHIYQACYQNNNSKRDANTTTIHGFKKLSKLIALSTLTNEHLHFD